MGLFGFIGDIASASIKVVTTPITVVQDITGVVTGGDTNNTKKQFESIGEDLSDSLEEITGERF